MSEVLPTPLSPRMITWVILQSVSVPEEPPRPDEEIEHTLSRTFFCGAIVSLFFLCSLSVPQRFTGCYRVTDLTEEGERGRGAKCTGTKVFCVRNFEGKPGICVVLGGVCVVVVEVCGDVM